MQNAVVVSKQSKMQLFAAVLESNNSLIQMIRLERVSSELNSQVKNREFPVSARATDAVKNKLLMSNFRINYCNWKSYLGQNCQLFVN